MTSRPRLRRRGSRRAGTSTSRLRRYSPSPLAWGSGRVDEATPSPSSPTTTKLRARRLGKAWRRTTNTSASGSRSRNRSRVSSPSSHPQASSLRAHSPTLAFPPLSPDRAPIMVPRGRRTWVPSPVGGGRRGGRHGVGGLGHPGRAREASSAEPTSDGPRPPGGPWWGTSTRRRRRAPPRAPPDRPAPGRASTPRSRCLRRGGGEVEPGVAGQGQLGCRPGEPAAHPFGIRVLHRDPQLGGRLHVGGASTLSERTSRRVELGELPVPPRAAASDRTVRSALPRCRVR